MKRFVDNLCCCYNVTAVVSVFVCTMKLGFYKSHTQKHTLKFGLEEPLVTHSLTQVIVFS